MVFTMKDQRSRFRLGLRLELTAMRHGFERYKYLLVTLVVLTEWQTDGRTDSRSIYRIL